MGKIVDLAEQRFGRLTALEPTETRNTNGHIIWRCLCECLNEVFVSSGNLRSGHTKSFGCLQRESCTTHGLSKTSTYRIWLDMLTRCENSNCRRYKDWGGRGIKVCERWHKFENFYTDMGKCPKGLTIERIDNDGNYELENCAYVTRREQQNNRRPKSCGPTKQRWFLAFNLSMGSWLEDNNQCAFAKKYGLDRANISACLHGKRKTYKGWTFEFLPYQA